MRDYPPIPPIRISKIVRGQRSISADTELRLTRYFGMSIEFWMGIQIHSNIEMAKMGLSGRLEKEVEIFA
ncbi:MAG: HigA family addiction module antidote protein [Chloroflexi bacterium]|nr:HigA family addiction module antidote protein [Chloroflexota bacterium]